MRSIRSHLLVVLLSTFGLSWALFAGLTYVNTRHGAEQLFDANLAQSARVLLVLLEHEIQEGGSDTLANVAPDSAGATGYEERIAFQVWMRGALLIRSGLAPTSIAVPHSGFSNVTIEDRSWRVFRLDDDAQKLSVLTMERLDIRNSLVAQLLRNALWPVMLVLPVLALLIWIGTGQGVRPLRRLTEDVAQRSPEVLDPVTERGAPAEVRPLVDAINRLLRRLENALDAERRFTANASHELRTPLAGIKAHAQVALHSDDAAESQRALRQVVSGVNRATRLVEQLLTLERLDPAGSRTTFEDLDLADQVSRVVAGLAPAGHEKDVEIGLEVQGAERAMIHGLPDALTILLNNILDNAIRYTPAGGQVNVVVSSGGDFVECEVTDTGPGIPVTDRDRVFDRFFRIPGNAAPGCGLGLSIARRIAEIHRAEIRLSDNPQGPGLRVSIRFPAAPQP